jgi:hypothetical protein
VTDSTPAFDPFLDGNLHQSDSQSPLALGTNYDGGGRDGGEDQVKQEAGYGSVRNGSRKANTHRRNLLLASGLSPEAY